ncbi:MAG: RDD family protein [Candidatus Eisenbacteria bacterium]|nr:RDD family protein [Candidatus Eisenbacteria bacterium]
MDCQRCGQAAAEGARFCASCGALLDLPPASAPAEPAGYPAPESAPAEAAPAAAEQAFAPAGFMPAPAAAPRPEYAGFWRRLTGMLVDGLLLFFPEAILRVLLGLPVLSYEDQWGDSRVLLAEGTTFLMAVLYCSLLECSGAQGSLGQQLLGIRVTDVQGRRIGFGRAVGRQFGKILSILLCCCGYAFQLWNHKRQTLHDMMSGCVVVRARGPEEMS